MRVREAALAALALLMATGGVRAEVTMALVAPLSGPEALLGEDLVLGVEAAVADLNAAGGLLGRPVRLETVDDACDTRRAAEVANGLSRRKVPVVIGPGCSNTAIPASLVYQEDGVLMIAPSVTIPWLTERGLDRVFRVSGRDDRQAALAVAYIASTYARRRIAVVHDTGTYGSSLADQVKRGLNRRGIEETLYEATTSDPADIARLVTKLKALGLQVVYFGGYPQTVAAFLRNAAVQDYHPVVIGGDALARRDFNELAGHDDDRVVMTEAALPDTPLSVPSLRDALAARGPGFAAQAAQAYAAVQIYAQAVERAGTVAPDKVAAALRQGSFDTVLGRLRFDAKGDSIGPDFRLYRWRDGRFEPLGTPSEEGKAP